MAPIGQPAISHPDKGCDTRPCSSCCWLAQRDVIKVVEKQGGRTGGWDKWELNVDIAAQLVHCEAQRNEICPARTVMPPQPPAPHPPSTTSHRIGTFMKGANIEPGSMATVCGTEREREKAEEVNTVGELTLLLLFTTAEKQPAQPGGKKQKQQQQKQKKPLDKGCDCKWSEIEKVSCCCWQPLKSVTVWWWFHYVNRGLAEELTMRSSWRFKPLVSFFHHPALFWHEWSLLVGTHSCACWEPNQPLKYQINWKPSLFCMGISYDRFLGLKRMQPNCWSSLWIIDHRGEIWRKMHIFLYNSGSEGRRGQQGNDLMPREKQECRVRRCKTIPIHKNRHDLQHTTVVRSCCFDMIPLDSGVGSKCYISSKMCPLRIQGLLRGSRGT